VPLMGRAQPGKSRTQYDWWYVYHFDYAAEKATRQMLSRRQLGRPQLSPAFAQADQPTASRAIQHLVCRSDLMGMSLPWNLAAYDR
jgi:hypothetical protein